MGHNQNMPLCQSCAMTMGKQDDFGSNMDGSQNKEYCHYCLQDGQFTEPGITMEQMMEKCECIMKQKNIPEEEIQYTRAFIPLLKRWRE